MRTFIHASLLCAFLAGGATACKRHDDTMDKASGQMQKTAEDLNAQKKDVAKDEGDLAAARDRYVTAARDRLSKLDAEIDRLAAKTDAKAHDAAAALRIRRDELAHDVDVAADHASSGWDDFKKHVDDSFDKIENDVNDALE